MRWPCPRAPRPLLSSRRRLLGPPGPSWEDPRRSPEVPTHPTPGPRAGPWLAWLLPKSPPREKKETLEPWLATGASAPAVVFFTVQLAPAARRHRLRGRVALRREHLHAGILPALSFFCRQAVDSDQVRRGQAVEGEEAPTKHGGTAQPAQDCKAKHLAQHSTAQHTHPSVQCRAEQSTAQHSNLLRPAGAIPHICSTVHTCIVSPLHPHSLQMPPPSHPCPSPCVFKYTSSPASLSSAPPPRFASFFLSRSLARSCHCFLALDIAPRRKTTRFPD